MPADKLTSTMIMSGTAVEGYEELGAEISGVVVGRITEIKKHPNADSLVICQTDIGEKTIQICTAAKNVFEGALVPVSLNGAHLAGGLKIKSTKMRGEVSDGMFCSYQELGLPHGIYPSAAEDGILIFEEDYPLGTDVKTIFGMDDIIMDFEILANRPDCQSIIGVSREVAMATGNKFNEPEISYPTCGGDVNDYISVKVENEQLCPRFTGLIVKNVKIQPSPQWMRNALNAVGIKPINNIVDITNYVMAEYGQPMHAYDLKDVRGAQIIVRNAKKGEVLRTLDEKDRELDEDMLIISDGEGATGIAGIMGGEDSEIKDDTTTIFFEAASFDFASVRVTAKKLGMRTAASSLFEKGVNPALTMTGLRRAAQLVCELGAGEIVDGVIDCYPNPVQQKTVKAEVSYLRTLMGVNVPVEDILSILNRLGIESTEANGVVTSIVPMYRTDIERGADLAEEVLRYFGYDKLPSTLMAGEMVPGSMGAKQSFQYALRDMLCGAGFNEAMTFSFISPKAYDLINLPADDTRRMSAQILNPLGEDYSIMRTTLVPSMLTSVAHNYNQKITECALFEIAPVFIPKQVPITELVDERPTLQLGMYGADVDFYTIKGVVDMLLDRHGIKGSYKRANEPYMHPGRSAVVMVGDTCIACLGQVHPDVAKNYKLGEAYIASIDLNSVMSLASSTVDAKTPPKYPAVTRDIALIMNADVPAGDCMDVIASSCGKLLDSISIFDVYQGRGVPEGKKSVAYTFALRAADRTLTDEEINKVWDKVIANVKASFDADLRS